MKLDTSLPKSYLSAEKRERLERESRNLEHDLYMAESNAAGRAGDEDTAWAWLRLVELAPSALLRLKNCAGAQFILDMGLKTAHAEVAYGAGWLDK